MNRRTAREKIFEILFESEFYPEYDENFFSNALEARQIEADEYMKKVYEGVFENRAIIDQKIGDNSAGWKFDRISKVSLTIMRICIYEMLYMDDVPYSVAINEAVELTKRYDDEKMAGFVNGVVNTVADKEGIKNKE